MALSMEVVGALTRVRVEAVTVAVVSRGALLRHMALLRMRMMLRLRGMTVMLCRCRGACSRHILRHSHPSNTPTVACCSQMERLLALYLSRQRPPVAATLTAAPAPLPLPRTPLMGWHGDPQLLEQSLVGSTAIAEALLLGLLLMSCG